VLGPDPNPDGSIRAGTETPSVATSETEEDSSRKGGFKRVLLVLALFALLVLGGVLVAGGL